MENLNKVIFTTIRVRIFNRIMVLKRLVALIHVEGTEVNYYIHDDIPFLRTFIFINESNQSYENYKLYFENVIDK